MSNQTNVESGAHPKRYRSRKQWIDRLNHDYLGSCPDEINGYDARDPECASCRHIDQWDARHDIQTYRD